VISTSVTKPDLSKMAMFEPLSPHQIADLLDILEDDERQVPTATS
jgi:hypothetical protein